jgi:protein TonB
LSTLGRVLRHAGAFIVACGGTGLVFAAMLIMNDEAPARAPAEKQVSFSTEPVKAKPPPKAPPRAAPKPERQSAAKADPRLPPPSVSSSLSGVDLGLPELGIGDASELAKAASLAGPGKDPSELVMSEGSVDTPPRALERVQPEYPARARAEGVEGVVTVSLLIAANGSVERAKVVAAEPPGVFDQAALDAVRAWRFEPASYGHQPVKVWARQVVRFGLL